MSEGMSNVPVQVEGKRIGSGVKIRMDVHA